MNPSNRPSNCSVKIRRILTLIAILSSCLSSCGNDLNLEVTSERLQSASVLRIRNIGPETVTVLDISINNRNECSTLPPFFANLPKLKKYDEKGLHMLWVYAPPSLESLLETPEKMKPRELKVGDSNDWPVPCNSIVRVDISTDKGSSFYSFQ